MPGGLLYERAHPRYLRVAGMLRYEELRGVGCSLLTTLPE